MKVLQRSDNMNFKKTGLLLSLCLIFMLAFASIGTAHHCDTKRTLPTITDTEECVGTVYDDYGNAISYTADIERIYEIRYKQTGSGSSKHCEMIRVKEVGQRVNTLFISEEESEYVLGDIEGGFYADNHRKIYSQFVRDIIEDNGLFLIEETHSTEFIYDKCGPCIGDTKITWSGYVNDFKAKYR